jgi:glutamate-1-semialdehyde 2,1-aminomutase
MMASEPLYEEAKKLFPGGVNSPVRAAVRPYPFFVKEAEGAYLKTVDGRSLIDYVMGYGPLILGHKPKEVLERVREQLERGWIFGTPTSLEVELAKKITKYYRTEMVRFVNSGTEATITAVRVARGFTGRKKVVKFEGCYHGANDSLLFKSGSAVVHYGVATSAGIPEELSRLTYVLPFNDVEAIEKFMSKNGDEIACIIVEPVMANSGLILPDVEFLRALRDLTKEHSALLIFDEVVVGFRLALGGAQEYFGVHSDITTLGKIIGGGFPIGALTAREEIMKSLTPTGRVFNAGTFNAHPVSMMAGLATIEIVEREKVYEVANDGAKKLAKALNEIVEERGIRAVVNSIGSMLQIFFTEGPVRNHSDALKSDKERYMKLHEELLRSGVFIPPSQFETWFTSYSHTPEVIESTMAKLEEAFDRV